MCEAVGQEAVHRDDATESWKVREARVGRQGQNAQHRANGDVIEPSASDDGGRQLRQDAVVTRLAGVGRGLPGARRRLAYDDPPQARRALSPGINSLRPWFYARLLGAIARAVPDGLACRQADVGFGAVAKAREAVCISTCWFRLMAATRLAWV